MEIKKKFLINIGFYGCIAAIVLLTYRYILPVLVPFLLGLLVAAVVQLPLRRIKFKNPRWRKWASGGFCLLFFALLAGMLALVAVGLIGEIRNFIQVAPQLFQENIYPFFDYIALQVKALLAPLAPELAAWILEAGKSALAALTQFATDLSASAVRLVASSAVSIPGALIQIILTVVSSFYISADYDMVVSFLKSLIPQGKRGFVVDVLRYARTAILAFIKSYSILFCITFLELWIGLSLLKIPYSLVIAFGIALFDLMPVLGTGGILLPWTIIALVLGNYGQALGVLVLYIIITIVRNSLEPRIVGNQIGLHPLATLVAMMLGLKLFGLLGMLGLPILLVAITNLRKGKNHAVA